MLCVGVILKPPRPVSATPACSSLSNSTNAMPGLASTMRTSEYLQNQRVAARHALHYAASAPRFRKRVQHTQRQARTRGTAGRAWRAWSWWWPQAGPARTKFCWAGQSLVAPPPPPTQGPPPPRRAPRCARARRALAGLAARQAQRERHAAAAHARAHANPNPFLRANARAPAAPFTRFSGGTHVPSALDTTSDLPRAKAIRCARGARRS
jgi:hypothetical protein